MAEYLINGKSVRQELLRLAARGNMSFVAGLHPGVDHVLGIKIPDLRLLAKQIAESDWEVFLQQSGTYYMEERILHGLVLGYIRPDESLEVYLERVSRFVRIINSWSVCDTFSFAGGKRFVTSHQTEFWNYLQHWMKESGEYEIRFGVVMALKYFINEHYVADLLECLNNIHHEGYYVKMAVAWAVAECFIKYPVVTTRFLLDNQLDDFTYNKSLQKIVESYRVDPVTKKRIKEMKRKL